MNKSGSRNQDDRRIVRRSSLPSIVAALAAVAGLQACAADDPLTAEVSGDGVQSASPAPPQLVPYANDNPGDPDDPGGGGGGGGGDGAPGLPPDFHATSRTDTSITLSWSAPSNATSVQLWVAVGPTESALVHTFTPSAGLQTFTHSGLLPDSRHCYHLIVRKGTAARSSPVHCAATTMEAGDTPVNRLQLKIAVADVPDAGTHDLMAVTLNNTDFNYEFTGLNYGIDNFARNSEFTYDLDLDGIAHLHDIAELSIFKMSGDDPVCIRSYSLLVNGKTAFSDSFGNTASTCRWLGNSSPYTPSVGASFGLLRYFFPDQYLGSGPGLSVVPKAELVSRLEGIIGSMLWGNVKIRWGQIENHAAVEMMATPHNPGHLHVDLDLEASPDLLGSRAVDVDFDLAVRLEPRGSSFDLVFNCENFTVNVGSAWWLPIVEAIGQPFCSGIAGDTCVDLIERRIEDQLNAGFTAMTEHVDYPAGGHCPVKITVLPVGDVEFTCQ